MGIKELINLPPLVLKARYLGGSWECRTGWDSLGFGIVVEDKPSCPSPTRVHVETV